MIKARLHPAKLMSLDYILKNRVRLFYLVHLKPFFLTRIPPPIITVNKPARVEQIATGVIQ